MKKIVVLLIAQFCIIQCGFADSTDIINTKLDNITNKNVALQNSVDAFKADLDTTLKKGFPKKECNCVPIYDVKKEVEGPGKWFLIILPFYLLILVVLIALTSLRNFKLTEALTENEPPKKTIKNPEYNAAILVTNSNIPNLSVLFPPTIEVSNVLPSIYELKALVAAKQAVVSEVQKALDVANNSKPNLVADVLAKQTALKNIEDVKLTLDATVAAAQAELDRAKATPDAAAITTTEQKLKDAEKSVSDNEASRSTAQAQLDAANKVVEDKTNSITRLTEMQPKAIAEQEDAKKNVDIAEEAAKTNTAYSVNTYRPSISRYIAFITSLATIILIVCMSSFFIYHYMRTGCPPDFGTLTTMVIALGLGITPYITNKISTAITANKP